MQEHFDEERIDNIGRNGGEGLHYVRSSVFHDQAEFLDAGDVPYPDLNTTRLAERLVQEEYHEWREEERYGSINDIKEALDLMYVSAQYLNSLLGPDKALDCWNALHSNNMSKCVNGKLIKRDDGKVLKPEGYKPLDLMEVLGDASYRKE